MLYMEFIPRVINAVDRQTDRQKPTWQMLCREDTRDHHVAEVSFFFYFWAEGVRGGFTAQACSQAS